MTGGTLPAGCLCLFTGALMGGVFLGLKLLGLLLRGGRIFTFFSDLFFGLFCAVTAFLVALAVDSGRLRLFQAALQCLGAWGAIAALGPLLNSAAAKLRKAARRMDSAIRRLLHKLLPKRKPRRKKVTQRKSSQKRAPQRQRQGLHTKLSKKRKKQTKFTAKTPNGLWDSKLSSHQN